MEKYIPVSKKTKKAQKAYHAAHRGTWEMSPVTRTVPNGKAYNRKKVKQAERSSRYRSENDMAASFYKAVNNGPSSE